MEKEADFINEAHNTELCYENVPRSMRQDIYVPKIHWDFTSSRVMTSEWIDGMAGKIIRYLIDKERD